jgi:alcohol dehydrogenase
MKSITWQGTKALLYQELPKPQLLKDTDAVIRVTHAATCGTDLYIYRGLVPSFVPGTIVGHEFIGYIEKVGDNVTLFKQGDLVYCSDCVACGACHFCFEKNYTQCNSRLLFGFSGIQAQLHGGLAEYVRIPYADITLGHLSAGTPPHASLLAADVIPTAVSALKKAALKPTETVGVIGSGPVGLMIQFLVKKTNAMAFAIDKIEDRLQLSKNIGVSPILVVNETLNSLTKFFQTFNVIFDAAGGSRSLKLAQHLVMPGGRIIGVGSQQNSSELDIGQLFQKEISLTFVLGDPIGYRKEVTEIIKDKSIPLEMFFSKAISLDEIPHFFDRLLARTVYKGYVEI